MRKDTAMSNEKTKDGEPDRTRVAKEQDDEVAHVAQKFGISCAAAHKLIDRFGSDPEKIYAAAETLRQGRQA